MRPIVTIVAWPVCLLVTSVSCAKTDEPTWMQYGVWTRGSKEPKAPDSLREGASLEIILICRRYSESYSIGGYQSTIANCFQFYRPLKWQACVLLTGDVYRSSCEQILHLEGAPLGTYVDMLELARGRYSTLLCPHRRGGALSDTAIRQSICPSPMRAAALGYRHAGCLYLSQVRTADQSADGRRSVASRTAIGGAYRLDNLFARSCSDAAYRCHYYSNTLLFLLTVGACLAQ